jgi:hypothetical protein
MRSFFNLVFPPRVSRGEFVKGADYNKIIDALKKIGAELRAVRVHSSAAVIANRTLDGTKLTMKSQRGSIASPATPCYLGEIYTYTEDSGSDSGDSKTGIRGGNIKAGDKNWNLNDEPLEIDLTINRSYPVWISIALTVNTDAANIATLSGVKTSEKPVWGQGTSSSDDYPVTACPAAFPVGGVATGVLIVPIGQLTVAGGVATLAAAGCGDITATHCPGTLDHYRGHVAGGSSSG